LLPDPELAGVVATAGAGAAEVAAGAVVGSGVFAAVWVGVAGADSVVALAAVPVWVGRLLAALLIALLTLLPALVLHPAARHPAIRTAARKERLFTERRITILPTPRMAAMDEGP